MLRRGLRIFSSACLLMLLASAITCQFWEFWVDTPNAHLSANAAGFVYRQHTHGIWYPAAAPENTWSIKNLLAAPRWETKYGYFRAFTSITIPWWLQLIVAGATTGLLWRLTRSHPTGPVFPIEITRQFSATGAPIHPVLAPDNSPRLDSPHA